MSQANAKAFAERVGTDVRFRQQLFSQWERGQAPTLTDITELANRVGYAFSVEDIRIVLKHDIKLRDHIASIQPVDDKAVRAARKEKRKHAD